MTSLKTNTAERVEYVARSAYGRLLAILAARTHDIAAAEDSLAHAFSRALVVWPQQGVPSKPEAWLVTVARNQMADVAKSAENRFRTDIDPQDLERETDMAFSAAIENDVFPDERLKLMFACTHPAIDASVRAPLMLQTVLGMEAQEIARLFLMPGATLAQRLVRAKRKIRDAGIPFRIPEARELSERLGAVLDAIYATYSVGWARIDGQDVTDDRGVEAVHLSNVLVSLMPDNAEVLGLAALLAYSAGRDEARFDEKGNYVPLSKQDISRWDARWLNHADELLRTSKGLSDLGPYQLEAAIQSVHCDRRKTGKTNWHAIIQLYDGLVELAPSAGALVARAAAVTEAYGHEAGTRAFVSLEEKIRTTFQPAVALQAHLHELAGRKAEAVGTYDKAISLTTEAHVRRWLQSKRDHLIQLS